MVLIADSGSTKTHWVLLKDERESHCVTEGLNPLLADREVFAMVGREVAAQLGLEGESVDKVYFYGAGCGTEKACQHVQDWLGATMTFGSIEVTGDLFGSLPGNMW